MKKSNLITLLPLILSIFNISSCNNENSFNSSLKTVKNYLLYLNENKNYTFEIYYDDEIYFLIEFEEKGIAYSIDADTKFDSYFSGYIQDDKGIYQINRDSDTYSQSTRLIGGEYLKDDDGNYYTSLWDDSYFETLFNKFTFISSIDEDATTYKITNKTFLLKLIYLLNLETKDFGNLKDVTCSFLDDGTFNINLPISSHNYDIHVTNIGTTNIEEIDEYLDDENGAYSPSIDLLDFKDLISANNYTRKVNELSDGSLLGYELFNEHYFYSETTSSGYGNGWIGLESETYGLSGSYSFTLTGTLEGGFTNVGIILTPVSTSSDIPLGYHYPSYLKILNNIEFFKKGMIEIEDYDIKGNTYYTTNSTFVNDFVTNFSIDQSFDTETYIPYALAVDIDVSYSSDDSITFFYYLVYDGSLAVMNFEFFNFGNSNIVLLDQIYNTYND